MTRVDGVSTTTEDGKLDHVHNQAPETSQPSRHEPPLPQQVSMPEPQEGVIMHAPPQILIQPQFFIQPPVYPPPPPPQPPPPIQQQPVPQMQVPYQGPPFAPPQVVCGPPFQQYYTPQPASIPQGWTTGLFDCVNDLENAIITLFCPCVTFGQIAATIDNGATSCEMSGMMYTCVALVIGCPCIISCAYRTKLRARFNLVEDPASDCITHCCCEYCALCQEYRELNHRGYNPSAGWMKNGKIENFNNQQQGMVAPPYQTMR